MKCLKACIAMSLDGFIAYKDGELDWIPNSIKAEIAKEIQSAKTLIAGRNTYGYIFEHWGGWPYKDHQTFIISSHDTNVSAKDGVKFLIESPIEDIQQMKTETDMLVIGGGKLITTLINARLLDELIVYTVPVMLGEGLPFLGQTIGSTWEVTDCIMVNDAIRTSYRFADVAR